MTVSVNSIVSARVGQVTCFSSSRKPEMSVCGFCIGVLYHIFITSFYCCILIYMSPILLQSFVISISVLCSFLLARVLDAGSDVYVLAVLFMAYFIGKRLVPDHHINRDRVFDAAIFTVAIIIIVLTSGSLQSPLFFLIYFLLFGLGLILRPLVSLTSAITIMILFMLDLTKLEPNSLITLVSLPMITPFAVLLGKEFHKMKKHQTLQEEAFIFLSTVVKEHIRHIGELAANFRGDHELDGIKRVVRRTEKLIDRFEKEIERL